MPIYHEWNGTILTITSDSGTSSADLKGSKGDDGCRGPMGPASPCVATDTAMLGGIPASEYAKKSDLESIDIEGYATEEYVDNAIANIDIPNPDLTGYALKTDLNDYATKSYVAEEVAKATTSGEIDLSTYATKNYVDESIAAINTDDFALKTDIPSLDGYATEEYVDNAVSNVEVDLTGYATEEYVNTIVGGLDAGGGLELELLWTNASPTAAFGTNDINSSTDVSVNLTDVDNIGIIFRLYSGNEIYSSLQVIPTSITNKIGVVAGAFTENVVSRQLTIKKAENKITFGYGSKNGDTMSYYDASMAIPYKIFAVKSGGNVDLTNYATKEYVDNAIDKVRYIEQTAEGAVITINDASTVPCVSVISYIDESESGTNTVELNTTGKNLYTGGDLTFTHSINYEFNPPLPAGTYVFSLFAESNDTDSTICNSSYFNESGSSIGSSRFRRDAQTSYTLTFTSPLAKMRFYAGSTNTNSEGDTATISNLSICGVGNSLIVELPETINSGSYEWVSGVLTSGENTYQLEPKEIILAEGGNTIYSSTGNTKIIYRTDMKLYIDGKLEELTNAIISLGGNV